MRYYTKEWYRLMQISGISEQFRPVEDKEYTDEEFRDLYNTLREQYVDEELIDYNEPPFFDADEDEEISEEDFDPEDYLIGDLDEDEEETELRHPESLKELLEYIKAEREREIIEFEEREPFDEDEAREEFDENYRDNLEDPDEDIPEWVRASVDPRLIALGALPEGVYKRLLAEDKEAEARFEVLDEAAEQALEKMYAAMPDEYEGLADDLDEMDADDVADYQKNGNEVILVLSGWDDEGDQVRKTLTFEGAEIIEDEGPVIKTEIDEDGDLVSNCELEAHELYFSDGRIEAHFLLNDGELKYLTILCDDIFCKQSRA